MRSRHPRRLIGLALFAAAAASTVRAQQPRPGPLSPRETTAFTVGDATITIAYGRPAMRGRRIFGGLRQYGVLWMPGADEATRLDTTRDLMFGDVRLPKGSYTIYTIPTETKWTLIISREVGQFHTVYHQDRDFARLEMKSDQVAQPVERLTITASPAPDGGGVFAIEWETTRASIAFTVAK